MRLCWNDWFTGPLRNLTLEEAKTIYDIGYRVAGINSGDLDATDANIEHVKNIFRESGLIPGPYGVVEPPSIPIRLCVRNIKKESL